MKESSKTQIFMQLKQNIERLKIERDQLNNLLGTDKGDLNNIEASIGQLGREIDERMVGVKDKERKLMELDRAISQTQKSYSSIVAATQKLSNALQAQSTHLRNITRK